jgi:type II secretory pathway component PulF
VNETFFQLLANDPLRAIAAMFLWVILYVGLGLAPVCAVIYGIYFLITLPLRRAERARFFLDLLELGLNDGRTPERAIADVATTADKALGASFLWLGDHIRRGMRLSNALELVPRLLPPQIRAMLITGERIGDVRKVLPACRLLLGDSVSQVRGALNYVLIMAFLITPFTIIIPLVLRVKVLPSYVAVFEGMTEGNVLPAFTRLIFGTSGFFTLIQMAVLVLVWAALATYVGGPRLHSWLQEQIPGAGDRILSWFPWRLKRLQRDFSAMLAVLLDAEVPEPEAVTLAANCTDNAVVRKRAAKVEKLLAGGTKLPEAIRAMDDSGELRWRLANALQRRGGFLRALTGWHEALDARAFQLEQTAAQVITTSMVLLNGLIVACIVFAIFLALVQILNGATLW